MYAIAILIVVLLGLGSRRYPDEIPLFLSRNAGDALWGSMVYLGFRLLLTKHRRICSLSLSLLFSFGIEFSQLYQAEWIRGIRDTLLGSLVLGSGFLWVDLIRYTAGIGIAFSIEYFVLNRLPKKR